MSSLNLSALMLPKGHSLLIRHMWCVDGFLTSISDPFNTCAKAFNDISSRCQAFGIQRQSLLRDAPPCKSPPLKRLNSIRSIEGQPGHLNVSLHQCTSDAYHLQMLSSASSDAINLDNWVGWFSPSFHRLPCPSPWCRKDCKTYASFPLSIVALTWLFLMTLQLSYAIHSPAC